MATVTVTTTCYVEVPDDLKYADAFAEEIVRAALADDDAIYLVKVMRESVLLGA